MNVALVDVDGRNFPNLALMKISAWHKRNGDNVEWFSPLFSRTDKIYASKVFTFSNDFKYFPSDIPVEFGGTGYRNFTKILPDEIDECIPDYSIYPEVQYAIGFLSRGCIRNCPWCVVPKKEGKIKQYCDIEKVSAGRKHVVLMESRNGEQFLHSLFMRYAEHDRTGKKSGFCFAESRVLRTYFRLFSCERDTGNA